MRGSTAPDESGFNPVILTSGYADLGASTPVVGKGVLPAENSCQ